MITDAVGTHVPERAVVSAGTGQHLQLDGPVVQIDRVAGHAPAAAGTLASAVAVQWIRTGAARCVLVVSLAADRGCTALLWGHPELEGG